MKLTEHCLLRVDLYLLFLCHLQTSLTAFYFFFFFWKEVSLHTRSKTSFFGSIVANRLKTLQAFLNAFRVLLECDLCQNVTRMKSLTSHNWNLSLSCRQLLNSYKDLNCKICDIKKYKWLILLYLSFFFFFVILKTTVLKL